MAETIEWFGATTFRLKANGLVIFLDTWLEKPYALPKYLDINDVTEADYIFISHAHFDHLPGADRIAKKTGAIVIANGEAINLLRSAGVHEFQLFPVAGGERIPMFTKADRDAAVAGKIPLANGPPGAPARPHHSRAVMSVHVWPSLHALMPGSGHHDIPDEIDTGTEYTGEATPYVCTLDVTMGMKYALMRLKEIIPPDQMDEGTRSMADYMEDRDRHVFSNYDGGQLAYNFLIGPGKTLFWNGHLGGYEGILKAIEPAPDVAILAIAGRANLNGRPYDGSAASFAVDEIRWLSQPKKVYWCLHDEGAIKPFRVNTAAATAMVHAKTSTNVEDLAPATLKSQEINKMAVPFKVIIAGGGLAGCLLANGLVNNGVGVSVYERDEEDTKREGFQIRLGESALAGFRACLKPSEIATIQSKFSQMSSTGLTAPAICNTKFQTLLDLGQLPSYAASWGINRVVLRDILVNPLKENGCLHFGKAFEGYEIIKDVTGQETVRVHLADGSTDTCDLLIGADGSNSRVGARNLVPVDSHVMILSKGPLPQDWTEKLPPRLLKSPVMAEQPADDSESGPKYNVKEASFYWGLLIPKDRVPKQQELSEMQDPLHICLEATKDWAPEYRTMLTTGSEDKNKDLVTATRLRASNKLPKTWRKNVKKATGDEGHPRVWLVGDAVHAMQPNRGMGGNQAFHDCADALPRILELKEKAQTGEGPSSEDVSTECNRYESAMIDRAFPWVSKSGGTNVPTVNLDGILGTILWIIGTFLVSAYIFMARVMKLGVRSG
ncbi:putative FAD dependent oxidoreductase [Colletotrichum chrysophilum]|uniref:FAD dependent oxidoreductase n=1 Tax=Colletotrichum chrysophilum TaxID=1836956 RepID=A0AAD9AL55_9PEZI|nr:putative FAD dependent oxidoreductase [Colletotrichum chrysophilum]